jgi:predicted transcriptional regulator
MKNVVTARVNDDVLKMIDTLAAKRDRSRAWIVAKLIESAAREQIEFDAFLQVGIDDIEAGRFHTQEEVEAWWEARKASRSDRIAAE